ncbi:unnamed protein product [Citrullus colocynthis]|uniref:Checkpoint protein n=1 Tax=Citrullus colocynthis TaxID=252529 RepID=A0ABP0YQQ7_9ROSI
MICINVENIVPLTKAASMLSEIGREVCLKFSPTMFTITTLPSPSPSPSPHKFSAILILPSSSFANYSVDRNHSSKVSLRSFQNALLQGRRFSSITIHLLEPLNRLLLRFHLHPSESNSAQPLHYHELELLPLEDWKDPARIRLNQKHFSIDSQCFKRIIQTFSLYDNQTSSISIISKGTSVTFSILPFAEITLSEELGQCSFRGEEEDEVDIKININPASFFISLANQVQRVSFFHKNNDDSHIAIMYFPFGGESHGMLISFPQI